MVKKFHISWENRSSPIPGRPLPGSLWFNGEAWPGKVRTPLKIRFFSKPLNTTLAFIQTRPNVGGCRKTGPHLPNFKPSTASRLLALPLRGKDSKKHLNDCGFIYFVCASTVSHRACMRACVPPVCLVTVQVRSG